MQRLKIPSDAPTAPPQSKMDAPYFVGRYANTGVVVILDLATKPPVFVDVTTDQMASLSVAAGISGLTDARKFFVGLPGFGITSPHVSLQIEHQGQKGPLMQGNMANDIDEAFAGFVEQVRSSHRCNFF